MRKVEQQASRDSTVTCAYPMAELQERVDFAERMLAQMKEPPTLPRGPEPPACQDRA